MASSFAFNSRTCPSSSTTRCATSSLKAGDWPADGCQLHVCFGPEDDIRLSEVWESPEKFQAFGEALRPRLERTGIQLSGEPEVFDVHVVEKF